MRPAALILSRAAINSSQLVGWAMPSLSKTALLAQIQLVECTLTGAAIQLLSYFENFCSASGTTASHFSCFARSLRSPRTPCWAQSRMSKPSICTAVGGHRHVLPGHALALQVFLQNVEGRGLAARCPPVQHLHFGGLHRPGDE